jgi:hypothetical protein
MKIIWSSSKVRPYIRQKKKILISGLSSGLHPHQPNSHVSLFYLYLCICYFFDIIIWVLFVGRGQSISCGNVLFNPIAVWLYSAPPEVGMLFYLCPSFRLCVLPSVPRYFSSHFSQQLLMAEIWYLVTSFI